jgi:putative phosphoribosyl transferase
MGNIRIISRGSDPFPDLAEAGRLLANELAKLSKARPVVLGIPRGGVVVARQLAIRLKAELDVSLACNLPSPGNPDLAIGAVNEAGTLILNQSVADRITIYKGYIQEEREKLAGMLKRRAERYHRARVRVSLVGRTVIITDAGMATGATMQASLRAARLESPGRLMAAVPVASIDALERVADDADEVVALRVPMFVYSISQFYTRPDRVSDQDVEEMLKESLSGETGKGAG